MSDGIVNRLRHLLFGWGFVGVIYSVGAAWPGVPHVLRESWVDRIVPFAPSGIWVYLSFFAGVACTFLMLPAERLPRLTRSFQIAALISGAAFVTWPTQLIYPANDGAGAGASLLRFLSLHDSGRNCLPSLHAALTMLCVLAHLDSRHPWRNALVVGWGLAMLHAILQTRRHLAVDIAAGLAVATFAYALARQQTKRARTSSVVLSAPASHVQLQTGSDPSRASTSA